MISNESTNQDKSIQLTSLGFLDLNCSYKPTLISAAIQHWPVSTPTLKLIGVILGIVVVLWREATSLEFSRGVEICVTRIIQRGSLG